MTKTEIMPLRTEYRQKIENNKQEHDSVAFAAQNKEMGYLLSGSAKNVNAKSKEIAELKNEKKYLESKILHLEEEISKNASSSLLIGGPMVTGGATFILTGMLKNIGGFSVPKRGRSIAIAALLGLTASACAYGLIKWSSKSELASLKNRLAEINQKLTQLA